MMRVNQLLDATLTGEPAGELDAALRERIVGQEEAIHEIVDVYQTYLAGMNPLGRPIGNFLFLGPTGTGKTRLVEATAEALVGDARAVIKIDCGEFQHSHEIARLIGSPPGYLGHRETRAALSQEALNRFHTETLKLSFVLFDEIEKASDALWNLLLGVLDKATLTLGDNSRVDFSQALIFMTSNLGAAEMSAMLRPSFGFAAPEIERQRRAGRVDSDLGEKVAGAALEATRRKFSPEFLNRLDKVVVFKPLGEHELRQILDLELGILRRRILDRNPERAFAFSMTHAAKQHLLREGTNLQYGARPLKRAIDRELVRPMSNLIATSQVRAGDWLQVDYNARQRCMTFLRQAEALNGEALAQLAGGAAEPQPERLVAAAQADTPAPARARSHRRSQG